MSIRSALIEWRKARGIRAADMAQRLGFHKSGFSRIEAGLQGLDLEAAERWAEILGLRLILVETSDPRLGQVLEALDPRELALVFELATLVGRLNDSDRRTIAVLLDAWRSVIPFRGGRKGR